MKKLYKPTNKELLIPYSRCDYIDRIREMETQTFERVTKEFHEKYTKRDFLGVVHGIEILALTSPFWVSFIYEFFQN